MTLRRIDTRFLLPFQPRSVRVLEGAEDWVAPLALAGIPSVDEGDAELVVAGEQSRQDALSGTARAVLVERSRAAAPGWENRVFLPLPSLVEPAIVVPLDRPRVLAYVTRTWALPDSRVKLVRNQLAALMARPAAALTRRSTVTLALRGGETQPFILEGSMAMGVPADADWFLVCAQGDELSRGAFVLFPAGAREPGWVLKFSRARGYAAPFDRDERGLRLAEQAGGVVVAHAPRFLGRCVVEGYETSVETAAPGGRLSAVLRSAVSRRRKERAVDAVASWVVDMGRQTAEHKGSGASDEVQRLARDVLPAWSDSGVRPSLLDGLESLPGVLQHNDLGSWNIVVPDGRPFTALDWESARSGGLPLWDLLYFLADSLTLIDGSAGTPDGFARLFRGDAASSQWMFSWIRRAVDSLGIAPDLVGPIATACWLHHGLSRGARLATLGEHVGAAEDMDWRADRYASTWLRDPQLGSDWRAWATSA